MPSYGVFLVKYIIYENVSKLIWSSHTVCINVHTMIMFDVKNISKVLLNVPNTLQYCKNLYKMMLNYNKARCFIIFTRISRVLLAQFNCSIEVFVLLPPLRKFTHMFIRSIKYIALI